jgi:hypothetical protein
MAHGERNPIIIKGRHGIRAPPYSAVSDGCSSVPSFDFCNTSSSEGYNSLAGSSSAAFVMLAIASSIFSSLKSDTLIRWWSSAFCALVSTASSESSSSLAFLQHNANQTTKILWMRGQYRTIRTPLRRSFEGASAPSRAWSYLPYSTSYSTSDFRWPRPIARPIE